MKEKMLSENSVKNPKTFHSVYIELSAMCTVVNGCLVLKFSIYSIILEGSAV